MIYPTAIGPEMNFDVSKWAFLEKLHDYSFVLRTAAFLLAADFACVIFWGRNITDLPIRLAVERPGVIVVFIVLFGLFMAVGTVIAQFAIQLIGMPLAMSAHKLWVHTPRYEDGYPWGYVSQVQARKHLAEHPDHTWLNKLEALEAKQRETEAQWLLTVRNSIACTVIICASWALADQSLVQLLATKWTLSYAVIPCLLSMPLVHFLFNGVDERELMLWPELHESLQQDRLLRARATNPRRERA